MGGANTGPPSETKPASLACKESSARMGVVVDALAHASGEAGGAGRPQHTTRRIVTQLERSLSVSFRSRHGSPSSNSCSGSTSSCKAASSKYEGASGEE